MSGSTQISSRPRGGSGAGDGCTGSRGTHRDVVNADQPPLPRTLRWVGSLTDPQHARRVHPWVAVLAMVCLMAVTSASADSPAAGFSHVAGPVWSVRGALCGLVLVAATGLGLIHLVRRRRRLNYIAAAEADPRSAIWSTSQLRSGFLSPRVQLRREDRVTSDKVRLLALSAGALWIYLGAYGPLVGVLLAAMVSLGAALASAMHLFATSVTSVCTEDEDAAAGDVRLDHVPARGALGPGGGVLLSRLGIAAGSAEAAAVLLLAAEAPTRPLVETVDIVTAAGR